MVSKHDEKGPLLDRRRFLKKAAVTCGLAAGAGAWAYAFYSNDPVRRRPEKIYTFKNYRVAGSGEYPVMVVVHGRDVEKMARLAIEKLGRMSRFISGGDRVLIKPNVGWDRQPEQAANTNPALVDAVVRLCREAGASAIWVTDVSINDPYRSFARSGIEAAVRKAGGSVRLTTANDFVLTDLKGQVLQVWPVSRFYHEADKVINMPVVKHHSLSKEINASIVDLASAVRPTLTITDATRVLFRNGPTGGNLSDVAIENTIVAGLDEVALDAYCTQFLDLNVADVGFLELGRRRGLGKTDWQSLAHEEVSI